MQGAEAVYRVVTTLRDPAQAPAAELAALYHERWEQEGLFQRLEPVLASEVPTLAHPRAALLAFSVAVVAYDALAVVQAALDAEAAAQALADTPPVPISFYAVAHSVREHYRGLLVAVPPAAWTPYVADDPARLALTLRALATHVRLAADRKQPKPPRGASGPRQGKGNVPRAELQHVSTARLLAAEPPRRGRPAP